MQIVALPACLKLTDVSGSTPRRRSSRQPLLFLFGADIKLAGSLSLAISLPLIGGRLLGFMPSVILLQLLAAILLISALKVWRHR